MKKLILAVFVLVAGIALADKTYTASAAQSSFTSVTIIELADGGLRGHGTFQVRTPGGQDLFSVDVVREAPNFPALRNELRDGGCGYVSSSCP